VSAGADDEDRLKSVYACDNLSRLLSVLHQRGTGRLL